MRDEHLSNYFLKEPKRKRNFLLKDEVGWIGIEEMKGFYRKIETLYYPIGKKKESKRSSAHWVKRRILTRLDKVSY
jgi:hypothetical protein